MNRKLILLFVIVLAVSAALLAKDFIVKAILEKTVETLSGLKITADSIDVGIFNTSIRVKRMVIHNPPSFPEEVMANINHLYVNYDITSGFRKEIRIKDMVFDVGLVNVIKDKGGKNNLNSLKIVKALEDIGKCEKPNGAMPGIRIDRLHLKGGKVIYKDYTKAPYPAVTEFEARVDEKYENITNPYELVSLIVSRSLVKTSPLTIIGFDLTPLQNQVKDVMSKSVEAIKNLINANQKRP
ncbi:MAG: hypothetical protein Q8R38_02985 [Candidatus Omnitrophota bacterium]|nr:hypothetical protein [Candidatus Omnitrophota bacterium]